MIMSIAFRLLEFAVKKFVNGFVRTSSGNYLYVYVSVHACRAVTWGPLYLLWLLCLGGHISPNHKGAWELRKFQISLKSHSALAEAPLDLLQPKLASGALQCFLKQTRVMCVIWSQKHDFVQRCVWEVKGKLS